MSNRLLNSRHIKTNTQNKLLNNTSYITCNNDKLKKVKDEYENKKMNLIEELKNKYDVEKLKDILLDIKLVNGDGKETERKYNMVTNQYDGERNNYWEKRTNEPYKNIIKEKKHYEKFLDKEKLHKIEPEELIVQKTSEVNKINEDQIEEYKNNVEGHNNEIKSIYSLSNELEHKKKFDYENILKYNVKYE